MQGRTKARPRKWNEFPFDEVCMNESPRRSMEIDWRGFGILMGGLPIAGVGEIIS